MATARRSGPADDPDAFSSLGASAVPTDWTDCAACGAPLPPGHRYVCAACAADSAERALALLVRADDRRGDGPTGVGVLSSPDLAEEADPMECPTCGMTLDASGRCAVCVTTTRR